MDNISSSWVLIHIENAYESWDDPRVRSVFGKTAALKFAGYRQRYRFGVIPMGPHTWVADHYVVCRPSNDGLQPIMGFERISLEKCRNYHLPFPPVSLCRQMGSPRQHEILEKWMASFDQRPSQLSYMGVFTIDPQQRSSREIVAELCKLMVVIWYLSDREQDEKREIVTLASTRFRIDEFLARCGFVPMWESDGDESTIDAPHLPGERARLMRLQAYSEEVAQLATHYRSLWANRMVLPPEPCALPELSAAG